MKEVFVLKRAKGWSNIMLVTLCLSLLMVMILPGRAYAATIQSLTFESTGGYATEHPLGSSFPEQTSGGNNVFGRNNNDDNWDASWGARTGSWFFGWCDPEDFDPATTDTFIVVSGAIDVSSYSNVQVSVWWRAEGDFEVVGGNDDDVLRMYVIEDSSSQPYFFDATESDLDNSTAWAEATETVPDSVSSIQIVIEASNRSSTEFMAIDDITITGEQTTAVTLASFTASSQPEAVHINWEAASELDTIGYHVYRAESVAGARVRLNKDLIAAQNPGSPLGAAYEFVDSTVQPVGTYYYWLEDMDAGGATSIHGPISVQRTSLRRLQPARPRPDASLYLLRAR